MTNPSALGYQPWIDVLRAVSFLMVFVNHFGFHLRLWYFKGLGTGGVAVFFAISGWLITRIVLRTVSEPDFLRSFYSRRMLRIFPAYFLTLALYVAAAPLAGEHAGPFVRQLPALATFNSGLLDRGGALFAQAWSLAVEERFYLLWPAVCLACRRLKVPLALPLLVGLLFAAESVFALSQPVDPHWAPVLPASILYGCLLALAGDLPPPPRGLLQAAIGVGSLVGLLGVGHLLGSVFHPLASLFTVPLVWVAASVPGPLPALARPLARLGMLSYPAYLLHMLVLYGFNAALRGAHVALSWPVVAVVLPAALLAVSVVSQLVARFVEQPCLALRNRLPAHPRFAAALAAVQFGLLPVGLTYLLFSRP